MRSTRPAIAKLLLLDLGRRPVSLAVLLLVISLSAGSAAFSAVVADGLSSAFETGIGRAGADIAIVAKGSAGTFREMLVSGRPESTFFADKSDQVRRVPGVEAASPQLFVASAQASCCSAGDVLIVAYDPKTDFVVSPWVRRGVIAEDAGSATLGTNLKQPVGLNIEFYGTQLRVAGALGKTGWGYFDNAAFVTRDAVRRMEKAGARQSGVARLDVPKDTVSVIWVRASADSSRVAETLRSMLPEAEVVELAALLPGVRMAARQLGRGLAGIAWLLACVALLTVAGVFGLVVERRKGDLALLRACGASRGGLVLVVLLQAASIGAVGGLLGGLAGAGAASVFSVYITVSSQIPVLAPDALQVVGVSVLSAVASAAVAGIAAAGPALAAAFKVVPDALR